MRTTLFFRQVGLLTILGLMVASARAAVFTANPVADAFVTTGPSNNLISNNYGGGGTLALSAAGLANGEFQSVLQFDTSGAKSLFDSAYGAGLWSVQSVT